MTPTANNKSNTKKQQLSNKTSLNWWKARKTSVPAEKTALELLQPFFHDKTTVFTVWRN